MVWYVYLACGMRRRIRGDPVRALGFILRDASRRLSWGAHARSPAAMLLRMRSSILMVRSAATLRVSNHVARPMHLDHDPIHPRDG
jgi:hypothetical protein